MTTRLPLNVAVIGAGMAGLTAAHWLVKGGASVTLLERSKAIGGRASTLLREGFYLNQGPHALYKGGAAYQMFTALNILPGGVAPNFENPIAVYNDQFFDLPVSLKLLIKTKILDVWEKIELAAFLAALPKVNTQALQTVSFKDWLNSRVKHDKVRGVLSALTRLSTYSNNLDVLSAAAVIKQLLTAQSGVLYLDHGWKTLVESMYLTIKDTARLSLDAHVTAILPKDNSVEITVNGTASAFDAVILAVPPNQALQLLPQDLQIPSLSDIASSRVACLDVCLKSLPVLKHSFALGIDQPLYYSVHSRSAQLAKEGEALIHLAWYWRAGETADEHCEARLTALLDKLQPNWQSQLIFRRYMPDMTASFGTPSAKLGGYAGVTSPALAGATNVYVCGDWVGAGHMLVDASINSARKAAQLVLEQIKP